MAYLALLENGELYPTDFKVAMVHFNRIKNYKQNGKAQKFVRKEKKVKDKVS